jgi:Spy/CpxP family protein refolding chaperone
VTQTISTTSAAAGTRKRVRLLMLGMLMAAMASWAATSWAQPGGWGRHHGGGFEGGMAMGGSPERLGRMMDRMLDGLNATDAQRAEIKQISQAAAADLQTQREAARSLRQQTMALHDQASKRMLLAMVDISRVLTPEQRAKIGERMKERAARHQERMERFQREHPQR